MEAIRLSQEFVYNKEYFRLNSDKTWSFLSFGWWPGNNGTPAYRWVRVAESSVPKQILELVRE